MPLPSLMPQIDTPEVIKAVGPRVACNGGGGALGHPRVFLAFGPDHRVVCPYCSRVYVQDDSAREPGHH
jgi:uncharacterized Zn-finger protein